MRPQDSAPPEACGPYQYYVEPCQEGGNVPSYKRRRLSNGHPNGQGEEEVLLDASLLQQDMETVQRATGQRPGEGSPYCNLLSQDAFHFILLFTHMYLL